MKVILHTRAPIFDDKGAFQIHDAGEELELAPELAEQLIAKGAAAAVPAPAKPAKPAA